MKNLYLTFKLKKAFIFILSAALIVSSAMAVTLYFAPVSMSADEGAVQLPIIMYHGILKDTKRCGQYIITPEILDEDLKHIKEAGFNTVVVGDLINYVYMDAPLPEKPIMITFDDGFLNNYAYAYPLLLKYDMKAVISFIGINTDEESVKTDNSVAYSYITWRHINEMAASGHVEFQNHSYNLHDLNKGRKGVRKRSGEPSEKYLNEIRADIMKFQERIAENTGITPTAYTYPFGEFNRESEELLKKEGFLCSLICASVINSIDKNPECLYKLGRFNRPYGIATKDFFDKVLMNIHPPQSGGVSK
ncbi:MAG: polysaccharide deacetylase family protein [Oscillospiraceae bacterium]|nr:polysaccharide deacetylase family protein [Oscillospiraceae bacterium]